MEVLKVLTCVRSRSSSFTLQVKLNKPLASWLVSDIDFYKKQLASSAAPPIPVPPREFKHKPGEIFFPLEELKGTRSPSTDIQLCLPSIR